MKEILKELEILRERMEQSRSEFYKNNPELSKEIDIQFPELIFAITSKLTRSELLEMTNQDLIRHIQYIQILES